VPAQFRESMSLEPVSARGGSIISSMAQPFKQNKKQFKSEKVFKMKKVHLRKFDQI
jgi:hypothetical protein